MSPDFCEEINNYISNNTKYDLIAFRTNIVLPNGKKYKRKSYFTTSVEDQIILSTLSTQSCIFEKRFFEKIGKWDESLPCWNDWELGIRALIHSPNIQWTEKGYHKIHQHKNSISGSSFTHDYHSLKQCILIVEENLLKSQIPVRELNACKKALSGRAYILAANLYKEKENSNHQDAYILANRISQPLPFFHICAYFIYIYAKLGGRGAWKLFLTFIR
jgi:aminopeptidase-like protein